MELKHCNADRACAEYIFEQTNIDWRGRAAVIMLRSQTFFAESFKKLVLLFTHELNYYSK